MTSAPLLSTLRAEASPAMGHVSAPDDAARTDFYAERDREALLRDARAQLGPDYDSLSDAQKREFEEIMRLAIHCAENLTGPALGSADVDTFLYDPLTGLPR